VSALPLSDTATFCAGIGHNSTTKLVESFSPDLTGSASIRPAQRNAAPAGTCGGQMHLSISIVIINIIESNRVGSGL
jgi:hypothetical protein